MTVLEQPTHVPNPSVARKKPRPLQRFTGFRLLLFASLLALAAIGLDATLKFALKAMPEGEVGALNKALNGKANAQIVINGSSRAVSHYNPHIIAEVTGKTVFNNGRNASHTDLQFPLLQAYLNANQKPELVIQNLDIHTFERTEELYEPAQYIPYLDDPFLYDGIRAIAPRAWKWKYLPLYGFAVDDMKLLWLRAIISLGSPENPPNLGYFPGDRTWNDDFERFKQANPNGLPRKIEPVGVKALEGIINLCQSNEIPLIFVYSPEYAEAQSVTSNRAEVFAEFQKIASAAGIPILDFSGSPISQVRDYFYNSQHLNRRGADLFSMELARQISSEFLETGTIARN